MNRIQKFASCLSFFAFGFLHAQVKLPAIISNNMVLQQNAKVALWGWAKPGEQVTVTNSWNRRATTVTADASGKWLTYVTTTKAGGPYKLTFKASNTIDVDNILLGEVWLSSGQSNMEFFIGKKSNPSYTGVINHDEVMKDAEHPDIRMIDVPNKVADEPQADFKGDWKICTAQTIDTFSAVAYFFAKEINKATGYPVGIINSTWGGTPAEAWTKKEVLQSDADLNQILVRYQKAMDAFPQANEKYKAALAKWKEDTSKTKGAQPRGPMGANSNQSPAKLYNGMIVPIEPYTLRGAIWYQGESNADRAYQYRKLFPAMIKNWRDDWNAPKLPFYFVQISPHRSQNPEIRDAQLYVYRNTPNTGMAVTIDNGDSLDIHPRNKELVGKRLSLWALQNEYGKKDLVVSGPLYKSAKIEGDKFRISFDYDKGLMTKDGSELKEFTIAGDDQNFVPANAKIEGNTVVVWSTAVKAPKAVRFAWKNVPHPNLYNGAGLPASPFRTDDWKLTTQGLN
ncbi:sialate O-acetylesterase [Flavisolibacter ginsenosidimutans]|uniref:Sialate O-acetylesterase n=1 Tax=Flavisolibacter ginsenosidimutans TaxID=661481 RepID=A0A5B8UG05_9BACT|nr:sialate O-acetylesterase [Flavisolibacter ginsenosidimutans]QEC55246.1 sialate O-acetylesterase [Flavisolibacter ginsenosidimutans]